MTPNLGVICRSVTEDGCVLTTLELELPAALVDRLRRFRDLVITEAPLAPDVVTDPKVVHLARGYSPARALVTASEWAELYDRELKSETSMGELVRRMYKETSAARADHKQYGAWHAPYIDDDDLEGIVRFVQNSDHSADFQLMFATAVMCKISAARCARVGIDIRGERPSVEAEIAMFNVQFEGRDFEAALHVATPDRIVSGVDNALDWERPEAHAPYIGWRGYGHDFPRRLTHGFVLQKRRAAAAKQRESAHG